MNKKEEARVKRTQRDYNLGFKLSVVDKVEKGEVSLGWLFGISRQSIY